MDDLRNPYAPGAGVRPAALVGRSEQVEAWSVALQRVERLRPVQPVVLHGLRGVGKTVLLNEFGQIAKVRHWPVVSVEARSGSPFRDQLARQLYPVLRELAAGPTAGDRLRKALATFKSFSVTVDAQGTWSFGMAVDPTPGRGDSGDLETDLGELVTDLGEAAFEQGAGVAILIDEAQDLDRDSLTVLCSLCHQAGQHQWPLLMGLAGLPSLPGILSEAKSYAERLFANFTITQLGDDEAALALTDPAAAEDVFWVEAAVDIIVKQTRGYPYFLQELGQATWRTAAGPHITETDALIGTATGQARLDSGFYRARWDRATPAERNYLRAMAAGGDEPSRSSDVAKLLHRRMSSLGPTRSNLIAKGLVYAPEHGKVGYTVPGMADFIGRQVEP